jgi:hypothetical protein
VSYEIDKRKDTTTRFIDAYWTLYAIKHEAELYIKRLEVVYLYIPIAALFAYFLLCISLTIEFPRIAPPVGASAAIVFFVLWVFMMSSTVDFDNAYELNRRAEAFLASNVRRLHAIQASDDIKFDALAKWEPEIAELSRIQATANILVTLQERVELRRSFEEELSR